MVNLIIEKPYRFVAPDHRLIWSKIFFPLLPYLTKKLYAVDSLEVEGSEYLEKSLADKKGILLTPNHCHPADPMVMGMALKTLGTVPYTVASWHLFKQNWFQGFLLPKLGVFSIYREGMDREALRCCTDILSKAYRPLLLFPEGIITRTNDHLGNFMEGLALIARMAAKQRGPNSVVIHPVGIRYQFEGNLEDAIDPLLENLEKRLTWRVNRIDPYWKRIADIAFALLCLKEIEYYGDTGVGNVHTRLATLIDSILGPHEVVWLKGQRTGDTTARVKALRSVLLPDMIKADISEEERARRWKVLEDAYLAQQLANYDISYFNPSATKDQLLEALQKFEEDLTDKVTKVGPLKAKVIFCQAIEVSGEKTQDNLNGSELTALVRQEVSRALGIKS